MMPRCSPQVASHTHGRRRRERTSGAKRISIPSVPHVRSCGTTSGIANNMSRQTPGRASGLWIKNEIALPSIQLGEPSLVMPLNV